MCVDVCECVRMCENVNEIGTKIATKNVWWWDRGHTVALAIGKVVAQVSAIDRNSLLVVFDRA